MNQNLIQQAYLLENQSRELEENIASLEKEAQDLEKFGDDLSFLKKSSKNSLISSIGKGVYLKTNLEEKNLFIEVGKGILVRKNIGETKELIDRQIKKLIDARQKMIRKLEIYKHTLFVIINELEKEHQKHKTI